MCEKVRIQLLLFTPHRISGFNMASMMWSRGQKLRSCCGSSTQDCISGIDSHRNGSRRCASCSAQQSHTSHRRVAMALHVNLSPQVFGCASVLNLFCSEYVHIVEQLPSLERSRIVYYLSHFLLLVGAGRHDKEKNNFLYFLQKMVILKTL